MAGFEYRSGGRRVSADQFWKNFSAKAIDMAMAELEARARGAAASIVDSETGRHAAVFGRRVGERIVLRTDGSQAFARELERRLGVDKGTIETVRTSPKPGAPHVYLAHASEDKDSLARPLAERLMASGIEVWFDEWEIGAGDSLKRRMEQGLTDCTHFVVLLTAESIGKPWVETEIDTGFMKAVNGKSRFIGLRHGLKVADLSIFLQTLLCPEIDLSDAAVQRLISQIHGVTAKPPRGPMPVYVQSVDASPSGRAPAAARVAEYLVSIPLDRRLVVRTFLGKTIFGSSPASAKEILLGIPLTVFGGVWEKFIRCPKATWFELDRAVEGFRGTIETLFETTAAASWGERLFFGPDHRNLIMEAGAGQRLMRLTYHGVERVIEPYALVYKRAAGKQAREYFYAYDRTGGRTSGPSIKSFFNTDIQRLEMTEEKFEPPTRSNSRRRASKSARATSGRRSQRRRANAQHRRDSARRRLAGSV
jgi:hypothetical protein